LFHIKRYGNISTGIPLTGTSNAGEVGKNRDIRSMTGGMRTTTFTMQFTAPTAMHQ